MLCCISHRRLCPGDLVERLEEVMKAGFAYVMIREKELSAEELLPLALAVKKKTERYGTKLIINTNISIAEKIGAWGVQIPFEFFKASPPVVSTMLAVGVSVHSVEEAVAAENGGADYILAGNIFETDCKQGLPGRGLDFIRQLRHTVQIPVWAVGGIIPDNVREVLSSGASVACVMSLLMTADEPYFVAKAFF